MTFLQDMLNSGAPVSYVLLAGFIVATFLFFHRFFYLHMVNVDTENFMIGIKNNLKDREKPKLIEAIAICDDTRTPVASMAKSILSRYSLTEAALHCAANEAATMEIPKLQRNTRLIAAIGQLAPLLGLFGTVLSLMELFQEIGHGTNGMNMSIAQMAPHVGSALITTAMGIAVAMIVHLYNVILAERCSGIVYDMEKAATELINYIIKPDDIVNTMNKNAMAGNASAPPVESSESSGSDSGGSVQ